jgi:hypothetical protein
VLSVFNCLTLPDEDVALFRCEQSYRSDIAVPVSLLRKGQKHGNLAVTASPSNRPISAAKLKDIFNLLGVAYGPKWRKLNGTQIYQKLRSVDDISEDVEPSPDCDCADVDDISLRI